MQVGGPRGLTVAEALVGLAVVIGFVLIVMPVYVDYRRKAVDTTMRGVLHNAKKAMEAFYATHSSYEGATVDDLRENGFRRPGGIDIEIVRSSPEQYEIRACAQGGSTNAFKYDSDVGTTVREDALCQDQPPPANGAAPTPPH